jgi:hypothetical protein
VIEPRAQSGRAFNPLHRSTREHPSALAPKHTGREEFASWLKIRWRLILAGHARFALRSMKPGEVATETLEERPLHALEHLGAAGLGRRSTIRGPDAATPHLVCLVFAGGARNGSAALASPLWVGVHGGH